MGDSVEYRDGVFVATGPTPVEGVDPTGGSAVGTALMPRPTEELAPIGAPGQLATAELPPAGPTPPAASGTPASGGARRLAVATIIASLIAAMAFGAAAFGGAFGGGNSATPSPNPGSGRSALGAAAAASTSATSVAFNVSATRATSTSTSTLLTGSGAVDLTTDTGKLTATIPAISGLVGSSDDTVNVVTDGSSAYLGSPALSSLTGGNTWLKVSLPKGNSSSSSDTSSLAMLADPSQLLGLLTAVGGHVTTVGNVDLHGASTTEYSTTVTLAELASRAGLSSGSRLGAQVSDVLRQLGSTSVPVKVWVGHDGYVRQISATLALSKATIGSLAGDLVDGVLQGSVPASTGGQSTTATTVTVGFSEYNAPVAVTVPPSSQTTDVNSFVHSVGGFVSGLRHDVSSIASRI